MTISAAGQGGLLAVHAHPDDETLVSGATLALYARRGVPVTLVTCTRGECGEVIPAELAHLEGDHPALAARRTAELAEAMRRLGVRDHHFLGAAVPGVTSRFAPREYHDSGMAYAPDGSVVPAPSSVPEALCRADLGEQAERLAEIVLARRPRAVLSYDPGGGYGHPDHIRTHQVTMAAVDLAGRGGHAVPKLYWAALPATVQQQQREELLRRRAAGLDTGLDTGRRAPEPHDPLRSMVMDDADVTTAVAGTAALREVKADALRAHRTQVTVGPDGATYALSNDAAHVLTGQEWYRRVRGAPGGERDADGRETDLLA